MPGKKTVRIAVDIPADQHAYLKILAAKEGLTLQEFVLKCWPNPEDIDQMRQAEEIMKRNRKVLKKLSK